ncbi:hypothetical protein JL720_12210 [Aureococcus anophagefferens]|nr:hypothetical protein JL720_12210 [Aureococcus anophagefferens]
MLKLLLSRGASIDVRNNYGEDPQAYALRLGHTATADLLAAVRGGRLAVLRSRPARPAAHAPHPLRAGPRRGAAGVGPRRGAAGPAGALFPETERRASLRSARNAPAALPKEVFWHIAQFWRSARDPDPDSEPDHTDDSSESESED